MSKKHTRDLSKFAAEKRSEPWLVIPWGETAELEIPASAFWPKAAKKAAQSGENAESMRLICGAVTFDAFVELTGEDAEIVASLIWELIVEELGVPLGSASPSSES